MVSASRSHSNWLHAVCDGDGPDILLVHGWASSGRMWKRVHAELRDQFRLWSVDLTGFGETPLPDDVQPTVDFHTATLIAFCQQHGIQPRAVIGHSMGGMLALMMALQQPQLVERLVLLCPVVSGKLALRVHTFFNSATGRFITSRTQSLWSLMQSQMLAPMFSAPPYVSAAEHARYIHDFQRSTWRAATTALESISRQDLTPVLPKIAQPTLIVVGERDFTVPPSEGRLAAENLPHAQLCAMPRVHHQPLDEAPDVFLPMLREFLCAETPA